MNDLFQIFPNLINDNQFKITSPKDSLYNCIAWAAKDAEKWWSPIIPYYWPDEAPREQTLTAYRKAYESFGFTVCDSHEYEEGFEKIAIYIDENGNPKHAARQLNDGQWTSKCGELEDIEHSLEALEGKSYGEVACYMKREKIIEKQDKYSTD